MLASLFDNIALMIMLTGALVGIASTLVGTFLILRGNSMLADAISHSIIFGIVLVWIVTHQQAGPIQIIGAAATGLFTVWLTELLASTQRVKNDAAIGLVFPALFSIGVLLLNIHASDVHIDQHTVLLGEIGFVWLDTLPLFGVDVPQSLVWMGLVTLVNAGFVFGFYKELKLATFDPALARALGFAPGVLFYVLLGLTSTTAVAAFDAVGVVLLLAFIFVPPAAAYMLTDRLERMLGYGCVFSIVASVSGYYAALALDVSIGGMMAVMTGLCFTIAFLVGPRYGLIAGALRQRRNRRLLAVRTLAIHLYNHEHQHNAREETVVQALPEHLRWSPAQARRVLDEALARHVVLREGDRLHLTRHGRAMARAIFEPWPDPDDTSQPAG